MSELPTLYECFDPPPEQKVVPGKTGNYVGVYYTGSHITIVTNQTPGYTFPKVELWRPIFDCGVPEEIRSTDSGYFAIWFSGIPSERGRYGNCVRDVHVTAITRAKQGRELRPAEYVR
jgi:hypothetical protein